MNEKETIGFLRFITKLFYGRLTKHYFPFAAIINVTSRCNLKCKHCFAKCYTRNTEEMTLASLKKLIDTLFKKGTYLITLLGGEPLIRKDIGEIIDYVKSKGMLCAMTTNGYFVPSKIEDVKKLNSICLSLDGAKPNNDYIRGDGSYDAVIRALEACKNAGIKRIRANAVLTKFTIGDIDFLVQLAKDYNFKIGFLTYVGALNEENEAFRVSDRDLREALTKIIRLKKQGYPIYFAEKSYEYALNWHDYSVDMLKHQLDGFTPIQCLYGRYIIAVDCNGDIYPCGHLIGRFRAKNFFTAGFATAYQNAQQHNCLACPIPCNTDLNLLFSLDWSLIKEYITSYFLRKTN